MSSQQDLERGKLPSKEVIFQGKNVVITGGASGIGRALVNQFQSLGADVSVIDVHAEGPFLEGVSFIQADVSSGDELRSKISLSGVDLLVIAAGVTSETDEPSEEEIKLMNSVNVNGVRNTLNAFSDILKEGAQVVFIGSDDPPKKVYAETKKQGAELVKAFANKHPELDVRILLLGPVNTALFGKGKPVEVVRRIRNNVGLYEPDEFAEELVEYLRTDQKGLSERVMYKPLVDKS